MTIHYLPRKSNIVTGALSHYPDFAVVGGSVKSNLLTLIYEAWAAACGNLWEQLNKEKSACKHGMYSVMVCFAAYKVGLKSVC